MKNGKKKLFQWSKCVTGNSHGTKVNDPNFPYVFGAGTEVFTPWGMNSGVMYINVENATKVCIYEVKQKHSEV